MAAYQPIGPAGRLQDVRSPTRQASNDDEPSSAGPGKTPLEAARRRAVLPTPSVGSAAQPALASDRQGEVLNRSGAIFQAEKCTLL